MIPILNEKQMRNNTVNRGTVSFRSGLESRHVLGQRLDATSYADATARVINWAKNRESRYVCLANVHVMMEAWDSPEFRRIINSGDLITADGVPLVWALRLLGVTSAQRVYGPDLTWQVCEAAEQAGVSIALYGGTPESLKVFVEVLGERFPDLIVRCAISPPFRPLSEEEDTAYTKQLAESGAQVLFVGIGCPKQEIWMSKHKNRLHMPVLGVGAAFDFHTGCVRQAPSWMQRAGLEWLFRFMMEPKRLWKRYAWHNPRFVLLFGIQYLKHLFFAKQS